MDNLQIAIHNKNFNGALSSVYYMPEDQLMKQLEEMKGLCKYCVGDCVRLENEKFEGTYRCTGFEAKEKNWYEKYREELKK